MAPTKNTRAISKQTVANTTLTTFMSMPRKGFSKRTYIQDQNVGVIQTRAKRRAECSPHKNDKIKRLALGNLTNNISNNNKLTNLHTEDDKLKQTKKEDLTQNLLAQDAVTAQILKDEQNLIQHGSSQKAARIPVTKIATRASTRSQNDAANFTLKYPLEESLNKISSKIKDEIPAAPLLVTHLVQKISNKPVRRISNEFNKTEESLYMSALEDISSSDSLRLSSKHNSSVLKQNKIGGPKFKDVHVSNTITLPEGVEDIDRDNWNDLFLVSHYAHDIFKYLKQRECEFIIDNYIERQPHITKWMRSLLVDWMVEVQETFELNHETLYLGVKIVDVFLCKEIISKDKLQLLGAAALFIACKFDERTPPLVEDFLYICDGAYKHDELTQMEIITLKTIQFDLGIPLSYRFLRRYARCAKTPMPTLTLARYILELSLMDYDCITLSDSKIACAALFMALRLHGESTPWSPTLIYYTEYQLQDFAEIVPMLNAGLHRNPKGTTKTIRSKYSHKIFHEVAKVSLMTTEQIFAKNLDVNLSFTSPLHQKTMKQSSCSEFKKT